MVVCACGYRAMSISEAKAQQVADEHRRKAHPLQLRRTEAKRRQRARQ